LKLCWLADVSPTPNPDQQVMTAVQRAYDQYGQQASDWIARFTRQGGTVHCYSGCLHCCNLPVRVSLIEALLTASALSPSQMASMQRRATEIIKNAQSASSWDTYFQRHRERIGYCPLLDQTTGSCTAYEVRPARCRDTYSALSSHYCTVGTLEHLSRAERTQYKREVKANPATDGISHYIAPLEDLGEAIWEVASRTMRSEWGVEVWGDFWVLTALTQDAAFMTAVRAGQAGRATKRAKTMDLWHIEIVQIGA
jgi:Fe-S-cluster containining protein